jgi:hypothetical protein
MARWYTAKEKATGRQVYVCKGFGEDGTVVAVYDPRYPYSVNVRKTAEECRAAYELVGPLPAAKNKEVEDRFMWELHR